MTRFALLLSLFVVPLARAQDSTEPVDFELEEDTGSMRSLHELRGRVVILFYEQPEHAAITRTFKLAFREFVYQAHLQDQVVVFGVANLRDVPNEIRPLARPVARRVARQNGVHVLMDWDGALQRPQFGLVHDFGTVVIVDRQGVIRHRMVGAPTDASRTAFYRAFRAAIRARASS